MALISTVVLLLLLVNKIDVVTGACKKCPKGEITGFLPTPPFSPSLFKLIKQPQGEIIFATCNKKKPKTKISILPGQSLKIERAVQFQVFRVIKLHVKVCKVTSVKIVLVVCRRIVAGAPPKSILVEDQIDEVIPGCKNLKFTLPLSDSDSFLGASVCGHQSITSIALSFETTAAWADKVVVKCVKMKGCLQDKCIRVII